MKKTLKYLLIAVTVLSVLSLSAQTHQYGVAHKASQEQTAYSVQVNPQMPSATIDYRHSDYMTSGSTLPQAAVEGTTTTYGEQAGPHKGNARRATLDDDDWEDDEWGDTGDPYATPIGDALLPLALLACAYVLARALRKYHA